jgi:hypothetical protein
MALALPEAFYFSFLFTDLKNLFFDPPTGNLKRTQIKVSILEKLLVENLLGGLFILIVNLFLF